MCICAFYYLVLFFLVWCWVFNIFSFVFFQFGMHLYQNILTCIYATLTTVHVQRKTRCQNPVKGCIHGCIKIWQLFLLKKIFIINKVKILEFLLLSYCIIIFALLFWTCVQLSRLNADFIGYINRLQKNEDFGKFKTSMDKSVGWLTLIIYGTSH